MGELKRGILKIEIFLRWEWMATHFKELHGPLKALRRRGWTVTFICKRVCLATNANFTYFALLLRFGTGFSIDMIQIAHSIL